MPIYEYVCKSCGRKTEVIARFGESPPRICSHCGGRLKKAFSAPAIQFKGTGWYVTDYARAGKGEKGEKEEKGEAATEKGEAATEKGEAATEKGEAATEKETSSEEKPTEKRKQAGEKKKEAGEKKKDAGEKKISKKE